MPEFLRKSSRLGLPAVTFLIASCTANVSPQPADPVKFLLDQCKQPNQPPSAFFIATIDPRNPFDSSTNPTSILIGQDVYHASMRARVTALSDGRGKWIDPPPDGRPHSFGSYYDSRLFEGIRPYTVEATTADGFILRLYIDILCP